MPCIWLYKCCIYIVVYIIVDLILIKTSKTHVTYIWQCHVTHVEACIGGVLLLHLHLRHRLWAISNCTDIYWFLCQMMGGGWWWIVDPIIHQMHGEDTEYKKFHIIHFHNIFHKAKTARLWLTNVHHLSEYKIYIISQSTVYAVGVQSIGCRTIYY